jgi:hypothetical protein
MKQLEFLSTAQSGTTAHRVQHPLTDADIIKLQDTLLTVGIHTLKFPNVTQGRDAMITILTSLNCYTNVACLSMHTTELNPAYFDMYYALTLGGYVHGNVEQKLDEFFLEQCDVDFLWIEATAQLVEQPWFYAFERKLDQFNVVCRIPVVVLVD